MLQIATSICSAERSCEKWKIPRKHFFLIEDEKLCEMLLNALGTDDRNLYEDIREFFASPYVYQYEDFGEEIKQRMVTFPLDASDIL
eukprot:UN01184